MPVCPQCGSTVGDHPFCSSCGERLAAVEPAQAPIESEQGFLADGGGPSLGTRLGRRVRASRPQMYALGAVGCVVAIVVIVLLASSGGSGSGLDWFGPDVRDSFQGAIDRASGDLATGADYITTSMHCTDQLTGISLTYFTAADARKQPNGATFNCTVQWEHTPAGLGLPDPCYLSCSTYVLIVDPDGSWQASLQNTADEVSGSVVVPKA
jgi:hypothetical protein